MRFIGADIRIYDIPKVSMVELVREFATSNQLRVEMDEDLDPKATHIRASFPMESCLKLWWEGTPQVVDWNIFEIDGQKTRIETRFGTHKGFRSWSWNVLMTFAFLLMTFGLLCRRLVESLQKLGTVSNTVGFYGTITMLLVLGLLGFAAKSYHVKYDSSLRSFWATCEHYGRVQYKINNCLPSHTLQVVSFTALTFLAIIGLYGKYYFIEISPRTILTLIAAFSIIVTSLVLLYFCIKNINFLIRITFNIIGIAVTFPLLIFYSLPYINLYIEDFPGVYNLSGGAGMNLKDYAQAIAQSLTNGAGAIRSYLVITVFLNLSIISLGVCSFLRVPKIARILMEWRNDFLSRRSSILLHRNAFDFEGFAPEFVVSISAIWVILSAVIYIIIYTILSVCEFSIFNGNALFPMNTAERFCKGAMAIGVFLFTPFMSLPLAYFFTRLILIVYCAPIIWVLYKVVKKRLGSYLRCLKERRTFILRDMNDSSGLRKVIMEIAQDLGVATPDIVLVPSKLLMVSTRYIGFPHFRSYIFVSEGCLRLNREEIAGLLAHEIFHIKRHSFRWYILSLLSDYTFFGNGFLAMITNSYQHELDADHYAAEWVKNRGSVEDFINGLLIMDLSGVGSVSDETGLKLSRRHQKTEENDGDKKEHLLKRMKRNVHALFELYFGEEILSYIHPPLEERIERIRALAGSEEN